MFVSDNVGVWGTGSMLWMKYLQLHIYALSVSIHPHNLLGIYLGDRKKSSEIRSNITIYVV